MKKNLIINLTILTLFFTLVSCTPKNLDNSNKVKILCSYFPQYDWTKSIIGGLEKESSTSLLIKNGLDLHSYKPEQLDYDQISSCNLLIFLGSPSEQWITEQLKNTPNPPEKIINLYKVIENITGSIPQDEHIWVSFEYAEICCTAITQTLQEMIPQNAEKYQSNYDDYLSQIKNLAVTYKTISDSLQDKTILLCDRNPFYYISKNYNLNFVSAISDCTAVTTAQNDNLNFMAESLITSGVNSIFVIEDSDKKISREVIRRARKPSCDTFTLNSLQCISLQESMSGVNYIDCMRQNLTTIQNALK